MLQQGCVLHTDHSLTAFTCIAMSTCWPGSTGNAAATSVADQIRGDGGKPEAAGRRAVGAVVGDVGALFEIDCLRD